MANETRATGLKCRFLDVENDLRAGGNGTVKGLDEAETDKTDGVRGQLASARRETSIRAAFILYALYDYTIAARRLRRILLIFRARSPFRRFSVVSSRRVMQPYGTDTPETLDSRNRINQTSRRSSAVSSNALRFRNRIGVGRRADRRYRPLREIFLVTRCFRDCFLIRLDLE